MSDAERDWYTTAEAAQALGITHGAVQRAIIRGTLHPTRIHARLSVVTRAELDRYRAEHLGQRGRKPHTSRSGPDNP